MPKAPKPPTLRLHPTGVYFVEFGGKMRYLSKDRQRAEAMYPGQIAEWAAWLAAKAAASPQSVAVASPALRAVDAANAPKRCRLTSARFTIAKALDRFLSAKAAELDADGLRHYRKNLGRLIAFMGSESVESLTPSRLQEFKEWMAKPNDDRAAYSPKTINHTVLSIRSMMKLLAGLGLCQRVDYSAVSTIMLDPPEPKGMSLIEARAFIARAMDTREQIGLACLLQLLTGCRASELPKLINGDGVWDSENVFRLTRHKTAKKSKRHRLLVLSAQAREVLAKLKPLQWANGHYYGIAVARIMGEGPGRLRHTAASILVRNGISRAEVDEWLGHTVGRVSLAYIPPVEMFARWTEISEKLSALFMAKKERKAA